MEKSNHKYYNGQIPYYEITHFIEPISALITIPYYEVDNITDSLESTEKVRNYMEIIYNEYYAKLPLLNRMIKGDKFRNKLYKSLTYTPHLTGYDFRLHPIQIMNTLFCDFKYDYRIPFINIDSKLGMKYLKDYILSFCIEALRKETDQYKVGILHEIKSNIDHVCEIYNVPIDIKKYILPKDALFYLAYRSLDTFEVTKDPRYLIFAAEYYDHVSHMKTSQYPHMISLHGYSKRVWFDDFRAEYREQTPECLDVTPNKYLLTDQDVFLAWDILKPGEAEKTIRETMQKARAHSNVDYEKYQKLFEEKMNFYLRSPYVKHIAGKYGLSGYMGFAYKNEYLVFDKFHNSDTLNPTRRTILTHGEAIYALPSDKFSILSDTKQRIIKEKETDERIKKLNHTETFIPRVEQIIYGPNVSTSTLEKEIEKQKKKILIRDK